MPSDKIYFGLNLAIDVYSNGIVVILQTSLVLLIWMHPIVIFFGSHWQRCTIMNWAAWWLWWITTDLGCAVSVGCRDIRGGLRSAEGARISSGRHAALRGRGGLGAGRQRANQEPVWLDDDGRRAAHHDGGTQVSEAAGVLVRRTQGFWCVAHRGCGASHTGVLVRRTQGLWCVAHRGSGASHTGVLVRRTQGFWCIAHRGCGASHTGVLVRRTQGLWCVAHRGCGASHTGVVVRRTQGLWCVAHRGSGVSHTGVLVRRTQGLWCVAHRGCGASHTGVVVRRTQGLLCVAHRGLVRRRL